MKCPACKRLYMFLRCRDCDAISRVHRVSVGRAHHKRGDWACEICGRKYTPLVRMPCATAAELRASLENLGFVGDAPSARRLGAFAVVGANGYPLSAGDYVTVTCSDAVVTLLGERNKSLCIEIPYGKLTDLEIDGQGKQTTDAGLIGGGFGARGAVEGVAIASVLNAATRRTRVDSCLRISSAEGEVLLRHTIFTPDQLRVTFSPIFTRLKAEARTGTPTPTPDDPVTQLERLAKLREAGALTEGEYQAARAPLAKRLTEAASE